MTERLCAACGRPDRKHRHVDDLCPPPAGSRPLVDVSYWTRSPGTYFTPASDSDTVTVP